jgi:hypothetical protein
MSALEKLEVVKLEACKFIGKSVYARSGKSSPIFSAAWSMSDWIFGTLDNIKEYAIDDTINAALMTWDRYDEKEQLLRYTVGRFMKADAPVPEDMDCITISENDIWHKMNGEWVGTNDNPFLYVQTWGENADNAEYEIRDFTMDVTEAN